MGGELIKRIKDACSEDNIVDLLRKGYYHRTGIRIPRPRCGFWMFCVKYIDDTHIKEEEIRKYIRKGKEKYEKIKETCFQACGAASDATKTFFTIILNKNEDISPTQTNKTSEENGPNINPKIRSFIAKYDPFHVDVDKLDNHIGLIKEKSKCMLLDMEKQAVKVKHAANEASTVFVNSFSERMKVEEEIQEEKKNK